MLKIKLALSMAFVPWKKIKGYPPEGRFFGPSLWSLVPLFFRSRGVHLLSSLGGISDRGHQAPLLTKRNWGGKGRTIKRGFFQFKATPLFYKAAIEGVSMATPLFYKAALEGVSMATPLFYKAAIEGVLPFFTSIFWRRQTFLWFAKQRKEEKRGPLKILSFLC